MSWTNLLSVLINQSRKLKSPHVHLDRLDKIISCKVRDIYDLVSLRVMLNYILMAKSLTYIYNWSRPSNY